MHRNRRVTRADRRVGNFKLVADQRGHRGGSALARGAPAQLHGRSQTRVLSWHEGEREHARKSVGASDNTEHTYQNQKMCRGLRVRHCGSPRGPAPVAFLSALLLLHAASEGADATARENPAGLTFSEGAVCDMGTYMGTKPVSCERRWVNIQLLWAASGRAGERRANAQESTTKPTPARTTRNAASWRRVWCVSGVAISRREANPQRSHRASCGNGAACLA